MNTTTKITFALFTALSLGVLAGCEAPRSIEEMKDDAELDTAETIGEADQAITTGPVLDTPPVLDPNTIYRIHVMETDKCLDLPAPWPVVLGEPIVRRAKNNQTLDHEHNTQAFKFKPTGTPNRYYLKPAKQDDTDDLCLYSSGASQENGGNIVVGNCNPTTLSRQVDVKAYIDNDQPAPWNKFVTISMAHSEHCLSLVGSFPADYVAITQYGTSNPADKYCHNLWPNQRLQIRAE